METVVEKDVLELFGKTAGLPNNIVSMTINFLGGKNAAGGMKENVYRNEIPYPPTPYLKMPYPSSQVFQYYVW